MTRARRALVLLAGAAGLLLGCSYEEAPPTTQAAEVAVEPEHATTTTTPPAEEALALMQGRWRSIGDASLVVEIVGERMTSRYDGEVLDESTIAFVESCPRASGGDRPYFTVRDEAGEALCYHLTTVGEALLEYTYVGRGNTLAYRRVE